MSIHKQKLLDDIEEAINRISTTGQSGKIGDLEFSEANLSSLRMYRKELLKQIARDSGRRPTARRIKFT